MNLLLRKFSSSCRWNTLLRAAAGSGLLLAGADPDRKTSVRVSVHVPWTEQLELRPYAAFPSPSHWLPGTLPPFYFKTSPFPSEGVSSAVPTHVGESAKPCPGGCLGRDTIANAAARVGPAVVNLSVPQGFYGIPVGKSIGSGTIIDKDGTILTCAHVVDFQGLRSPSKGKSLDTGVGFSLSSSTNWIGSGRVHYRIIAKDCELDTCNAIILQVAVTLQDGRTFEGIVTNVDIHSDIALVKIDSKTPLPTASLGSSSRLRPGNWVLAMGCPLSLQNTVTAGIVSCVDRKSSDLGLGGIRREYLQTDCAINAGNSGGPLVNIDGEVIGVNTMKVLGADGLSFSVPIDSVSKIVAQFRKSGRVIRPWLGLKMVDLNEMIIAQLKERDPTFPNVSKGLLIVTVTPGSPADRAGILPGDVVVEFDGKPVGNISEIIEIMGDRIGVPMKVVVKRSRDRVVALTATPDETRPDI